MKMFFHIFSFLPLLSLATRTKQSEIVADVVTEVNYVLVYRVCFWERLPEVLSEEASYLCDVELSKDRLLVFPSLVITE